MGHDLRLEPLRIDATGNPGDLAGRFAPSDRNDPNDVRVIQTDLDRFGQSQRPRCSRSSNVRANVWGETVLGSAAAFGLVSMGGMAIAPSG